MKQNIVLLFLVLICCFSSCRSSIDSKNVAIKKAHDLPQDTLDCLQLVYNLIWTKSNYWNEFKKRKNRGDSLFYDISDSETVTYINNIENNVILIQITPNDEYAAKAKLTEGIEHTVSWLSLDLNNNKLWTISGDDSILLKFDSTLLPRIREKVKEKQVK